MALAPGHRTSDVIIIGGGVLGLSVAVHLRWRGLSVTILERDRIGDGTSTRGFGTVSALGRRPASYLRLMLAAQAYYPDFADRLGSPDIYRITGALALVRDEGELVARRSLIAEQEAVAGYASGEVLDGPALRKLEPALRDAFPWGVYRAHDGTLEPAALLGALRHAAIREGGAIVEGARVEATVRQGNSWHVETPIGTFSSPVLVNCAGVWAEQVGQMADVQIPVRSVRGQIVVVAKGEQVLRRPVGWSGKLDVRQATDGRYWLGTVEQPDSWNLDVRREDTATILGRVAETFVGIADQPVSEVWAGLRPVPADGLPLIGRMDGVADYHVAVTHGGLSFCGVIGRGLAALIAGEPADSVLAPFDPNRPMPGWRRSDSPIDAIASEIHASATRHGMRTDATDWTRVAAIASRSTAAGQRLAAASTDRSLPTSRQNRP